MAEKLMEVSKTVSWVKRGKGGTYHDKKTGEPRPYQMWSFKVEGDERYFTFFEKSGTPNPVIGAIIKAMEYDYEKTYGADGKQYDNYKVKWMTYEDAPMNEIASQAKPEAIPATFSKSSYSNRSMYDSYAKDLLIAHMNLEPEAWKGVSFDQLCEICILSGGKMCDIANTKEPPKTNIEEVYGKDPTFSDGTPIGEPPDWVR